MSEHPPVTEEMLAAFRGELGCDAARSALAPHAPLWVDCDRCLTLALEAAQAVAPPKDETDFNQRSETQKAWVAVALWMFESTKENGAKILPLRTLPAPDDEEGWKRIAADLDAKSANTEQLVNGLRRAREVPPDFWWQEVRASSPPRQRHPATPIDDRESCQHYAEAWLRDKGKSVTRPEGEVVRDLAADYDLYLGALERRGRIEGAAPATEDDPILCTCGHEAAGHSFPDGPCAVLHCECMGFVATSASSPSGEEPRDWKPLMQLIGPAEIIIELPTAEPFGHRQRLVVRAGDMLEIRLAALHSRSPEKSHD